MTDSKLPPKFWVWFFRGSGGRPGFSRVVNSWLLLHAFIGSALAVLVPLTLKDAAVSILAPLAGFLIGLTFAWAANGQALLQCDEIESLAQKSDGDIPDYAYTYLLSVLVVLVTLVLWGLAGLGIFDSIWPKTGSQEYICVEYILYLMASLTMRTSWHVVLGTQSLLLVRWTIRKKQKEQ